MSARARKWLATAAIVLAASLALQQLRAHQPLDVALRFDLHGLELKVPATTELPAERLTADKLEGLRFEVRAQGEIAASGEVTIGAARGQRPGAASTPEFGLRRGEYALAITASFRRFDGTAHRAYRLLPLRVEDSGPVRVTLRDP